MPPLPSSSSRFPLVCRSQHTHHRQPCDSPSQERRPGLIYYSLLSSSSFNFFISSFIHSSTFFQNSLCSHFLCVLLCFAQHFVPPWQISFNDLVVTVFTIHAFKTIHLGLGLNSTNSFNIVSGNDIIMSQIDTIVHKHTIKH